MRRLGKVVKWAVIGLVAAEWYARHGREFIWGDRDFEFGVDDEIRTWVPLPHRVPQPTAGIPGPLLNDEGDEIGRLLKTRRNEDARGPDGREVEQWEVYAEVERDKLGYPINVALAQIESFAKQTLEAAHA